MDRFITYQEDDQKWKKNASEAFKGLKSKVDAFVWVAVVGTCLAMVALLISVMH